MRIDKLKETIANYQKLLDRPTDDNYVSLIAVEEVLKKKQLELQEKLREFERYVSAMLNNKCSVKLCINSIDIYYSDGLFADYNNPNKHITIFIDGKTTRISNPFEEKNQLGKYNHTCKMLDSDKRVQDFVEYIRDWHKKYLLKRKIGLLTNIGLYVDFEYHLNKFKMILSDSCNISRPDNISGLFDISPYVIDGNSGRTDLSPEEKEKIRKEEEKSTMNFYYYKNILFKDTIIKFKNRETEEMMNESIIADIYSKIKVDISSFSNELQNEMQAFETYYKLKLQERADSEKTSLKVMQTKRIMDAYQKFKEATELLNSLKMEDITIDKIHMDDLDTMFFKNNTLLRMLDLSSLDFTNVDIRGVDLSGTNANIHPQLIYNKDMSNVNASKIKFSPFKPEDRFDDVILDGTIIDDYEAMIDLNTVRSYNNQTVIPVNNKKNR